ncbi:hypothetical protein NCCP28_33700 [Niallia sp. NCCP-28]|nr:hypothetical protein NCCP28_33700 [Niallia sp. NCCP-28]
MEDLNLAIAPNEEIKLAHLLRERQMIRNFDSHPISQQLITELRQVSILSITWD